MNFPGNVRLRTISTIACSTVICQYIAWLCPALGADPPTPAAPPRDPQHWNLDKSGLALSGYDPVSYFPEGGGKPLKGRPEWQAKHLEVTYHFATEQHRKLFTASPDKFEPAYGGWCAYAMGARGKKVTVDPTAFELREGRLFLFYVGAFNDTRKPWAKDRATLLPQADRNWQKLTGAGQAESRPKS